MHDKVVRQSIALALDKDAINRAVNGQYGRVVESPILSGNIGYDDKIVQKTNDIKLAQKLLSQAGYVDTNDDHIREKDGKALTFELVIPSDKHFKTISDMITDQLKAIGVNLHITAAISQDFTGSYLSPRNYDMIIVGENIGADPDPYSYWHSSQITAPGLNISLYENGEVDKLLEEARNSTDNNVKIRNYKKFQEILVDDNPAVFLYQPSYLYIAPSRVQGIDLEGLINPADRFKFIRFWHID